MGEINNQIVTKNFYHVLPKKKQLGLKINLSNIDTVLTNQDTANSFCATFENQTRIGHLKLHTNQAISTYVQSFCAFFDSVSIDTAISIPTVNKI